ncbi:MAG: ABC transporter ATP-binding protein [Actinomyces sp.]|jgi:putative ABC transport system ATP-binding protein|nr:ABC transporter ATP-binding protein [Actinomyces sp.]MCI1662690.1 ABC transporter ATP-binding protein [Actinomyces sp.]MCI1787324.1 ABC transporter ATP-binding protein [Actinomyces sp.]MCI1830856.1 ABC transporter ATP-binding protein [Actinomyces sp.]
MTDPDLIAYARGQASAQNPAPTGAPAPLPDGSGIAVAGLVKQYRRGQQTVTALAGVDLALPRGAQVAIMGPSGSGKTTLLHCIAGILRPTSGSIVIEGAQIAGLSEKALSALRLARFGFVFQDGQLLPELSAAENVALPLMLAGRPRGEATGRAQQVMAMLGIVELGPHRPGQLSGGQAQRVAIARALVASPQVVFADEPTGALDQTTGHEVMSVLTGACRATGATLLLVTHDPGVASWFPQVIRVQDGRVLAAGAPVAPQAPAPQRSPQMTQQTPFPSSGSAHLRGAAR